ncbi:transcriptional regulator [Saccharothrix stipae]
MRRLRLAPGFDYAAQRRTSGAPLYKDMDIDRTVLHRVRTGKAQPGAAFIAGALIALAPAKFEDLFEVVAADEQ